MELANQVLYLTATLIVLGMGFAAYRATGKSVNFDEGGFFWFYALIAQIIACAGMFLFPYVGIVALTIGSAAQITVGILLGFLFRSFSEAISKHYILTVVWVTVVFVAAFANIGYQERLLVVCVLAIALSAWQLYELGKAYKKERSIYVLFMMTAISLQVIFSGLRMVLAMDVGDPIKHALTHRSEYDDEAIEMLIRMVLIVLYLLIFIGVSNYFLEKLWKIAVDSVHAKEDQMLHALNTLAMARDNETGKHLLRTREFVKLLCDGLRRVGLYSETLSDSYVAWLYKVAPLHDIGKIAIPDEILLKQGKHTAEEFEIMKTHTALGRTVLTASKNEGSGANALLDMAAEVAGLHHEHWDGSGYPDGLRGHEISLAARIMCLADVYDALTTHRVYKTAWTHEEAVIEITKGKGTCFDPGIVEAFIIVKEEFREVAKSLRDH